MIKKLSMPRSLCCLRIQTVLAGVASLVSASLASAAIVAVDFGADYTSSNINSSISPVVSTVDADFDGFADDRAAVVAFGTVFTPPNSANWTTPEGKSGGVILHGVSVAIIDWDSETDPPASIKTDRISSADIIQVGNGAGTSAMRMASAFYWEKSSFINGADGVAGLSFADQAEGISASFNNSGTPTNSGGRLSRVLVESDGSWYVSASVFGSTNGTISFNGYTTNWHAFDPAAGTLFWDTAAAGAGIAGSLLTDITALGVYTQHDLFNGSAENAAIQGFSGLQVTLVPEPSTCVVRWRAGPVAGLVPPRAQIKGRPTNPESAGG